MLLIVKAKLSITEKDKLFLWCTMTYEIPYMVSIKELMLIIIISITNCIKNILIF